jgi:hypothetical protein
MPRLHLAQQSRTTLCLGKTGNEVCQVNVHGGLLWHLGLGPPHRPCSLTVGPRALLAVLCTPCRRRWRSAWWTPPPAARTTAP